MDLNYAKWDKVVEEDSSEDSDASCKGSSCCGTKGRGNEGEDGINDGDSMCSTCYPDRLSDCPCPRCSDNPFNFIRSMMEATEKVEARLHESAASIVGDGFFTWTGGGGSSSGGGGSVDTEGSRAQGRRQGPSKKGPNCRNLEPSSVDSSDWEFSTAAGEGGSGNGSRSKEVQGWPVGNDTEGSGMSSEADGDLPTPRCDMYKAFERARARQTSARIVFSRAFWVTKDEFTSAAFKNFYLYKVLKGRPVPYAGDCLLLHGIPRGFPEFVDLVGRDGEDSREKISRADLPPGFYEYAREVVAQQAKSRRDEETPDHNTNILPWKAVDKASTEMSKKDDKSSLVNVGYAEAASSLRREFEAMVLHRRKADNAVDSMENQVRSVMDKLDLILQLEEAKHKKELAGERAVTVAARAELKAFVDGGAGVKLLSVKEALEKAETLKKRANAVLADTRYPEAVEHYTLGIKVLQPHVKPTMNGQQGEDDGEEDNDSCRGNNEPDNGRKEQDSGEAKAKGPGGKDDNNCGAAREMLLILLCNRSLAHLKWGNPASAKADAQQGIGIDPCHIKAYFRRAAAYKQAERYREALSDLKHILRLEPPPGNGAAVSDDMLAVQKMARDCEQKLRAKGFKKALEEAKSPKPGTSTLSLKEARVKWDASRGKGSKNPLPRPKVEEVWEQRTDFLPPWSVLPTLKELSAAVVAENIDRAPGAYVHWCEGLLSEYLACVFAKINWVSLQTMVTSGIYNEVCTISSNAQASNWLAQDRYYRRLYAAVGHDDFLRASMIVAAGRGAIEGEPLPQLSSWKVLDPHLGLMDVLENHALFTHQEWDAEEEAMPKLFDFNPVHPAGRAVVNRAEFFQQFNIFTEGQLTFMDWNNVVAAGGSVLAATHPPPPGPLREFYHTQAYRASDVDLFVYGLDEKAATEKVKTIYQAIKLANSKIFAVRTLRAITFVSAFPYRKIQIVLRLYKTLAEVLHGFDVDACSIGFDGHTVWCTNRAARAICKRYNVVDLSRRSPSYESRLFKYSKRGHAVFVKGMKVDKIAPSLQNCDIRRHPDNEQGLAKLISLDRRFRRFNITFTNYYERWYAGLVEVSRDEVLEARNIHREEHKPESDYTHIFIPYGRNWSRDRTWSHVNDYIRSANTWYYRLDVCREPRCEIQPVVVGTIEHVLDTGVNTGKTEKSMYSPDEEMMLVRMKHVKSDEMWIKDNPGSQGMVWSSAGCRGERVVLLTGSFNPQPCSQEAWAKDAYVTIKRSSNRRS